MTKTNEWENQVRVEWDLWDNGRFGHLEGAIQIIEELLKDKDKELQKAREEERERIEAIFKEHVPPHAMDLEDSVWLKRLLNKAFEHENIY